MRKKNILTKNNNRKKLPAYSLLEMVVTLLLTGIVMLGLIFIFTSILNISAMANARTKTREDVDNFVQEFEKDLKNSTRVGKCEIAQATGEFSCIVYTNDIYVWKTCPRTPDMVEEAYPYVRNNPSFTDWDKAYNKTEYNKTLCKYKSQSDGTPIDDTKPDLRLDLIYNLEYVDVKSLEDNIDPAGTASSTGTKKLITFTVVVSHPNKKMKVLNVIRQSVVTTKNYEITVQK